jgi:NTE family protein
MRVEASDRQGPDPIRRPDVLVLGAGGALGRAWMSGVLAGIESASDADFRRCRHFVGTSAGSIVAAALAAGIRPRGPRDRQAAPERAANGGAAAAGPSAAGAERLLAPVAPLAAATLRMTAPAGAFVRAAMLARAPSGHDDPYGLGERIGDLGGRFDGRLFVVAVERASGRRVVFGTSDAPKATVAQAVKASCAIPGVFRSVTIDGREYADGGAWSLTNIDVAPVRSGDRVLCLNPCGGSLAAARGLVGGLAAWARARAALEAQAARRHAAAVRVVGPDREATRALGPNLMDHRRTPEAVAAGYRQGRRMAGAG